ncbi:putative ribosomal rna methyltransferase mrm2 protein [Phaeoacremonium minimum UCRPA7]|uniref:rRNA methyltransferase 2, mitochondrial n=1 Tax=Phaeoacremonium minimum (strain UCR-PA7) TaxID=1286976 RepID=R8BQT4_PHAM7|nr:putative ribosomal rna methyltransferase mrm2 protein [Phaeoacremonium minimum UCRPA7]EOO01721.1 putative ribosomal rna methyltransferase mrm2 protein [Phaeoacremonium minimum UCRPA7]
MQGYAPGSWSQVAVERTKPSGRVVGIDILPAQPPKGVATIQGNFLSPGVQALVKHFLAEQARRPSKTVTAPTATSHAQAEPSVITVPEGEEAEGNVVVDRPSYIDLEREASHEAEAPGSEEDSRRLVDIVISDMSEPWPQTAGFSSNTLSNPYIRMMNTSGIAFKDHAGSMDLCEAALQFASDTLRSGGHFLCKFYQGAEDKLLENKLKKMFAKVHREKPESSRSESKEAYFVALRRKGNVVLEDIQEP